MTDLQGFGYAIADLELSHDQCAYIATALPAVGEQRGTARGLLSHPTIVQLIRHKQLSQFLWTLTGRELVAVAARLLDSVTDDADRQWHQDRRVAVRERMDVAGYVAWTSRVGVWHVEPPASVLAQMIVVRLHFEESAAGTHPLGILPGSHTAGKLTPDAIQEIADSEPAATPEITRGTLVVMRPLLVHRSLPSTSRYRVLHLEFAPEEAISPLQWHETVNLYRAA